MLRRLLAWRAVAIGMLLSSVGALHRTDAALRVAAQRAPEPRRWRARKRTGGKLARGVFAKVSRRHILPPRYWWRYW